MTFNSLQYAAFLPIVVLIYWRLSRRAQNVFLLGASYLFARSSPKLRQRLLASRLAAPLRRYEETRCMTAGLGAMRSVMVRPSIMGRTSTLERSSHSLTT